MIKFLFLFIIIFNAPSFANDKEVLIYKDFLQEPVSFSESVFLKSFDNSKDYRRFFTNFVKERELTTQLAENNSLIDVLNVCYLTYLETEKEKYKLSKEEGKYCLYNLATSGISEAFSYIANYHFNEYKKTLYKDSKVDVDELIKVSYYFGLADSFSLNYELGNSILEVDTLNFESFINDSLVKVNNKDVLRSYFNNAKLLSINLPVNSLILQNEYSDHIKNISENYKTSFLDEDVKLFDSIKKGNFRILENKMKEINEEESEYLSNINYKESSDIYKLCSDVIFSRADFKIKSNLPEFCLSQLSFNELNPDASYDLGFYFYIVANSQESIEVKKTLLNKSIFWLSLSNLLGHEKSLNLFKRILVENKDKGFNDYIVEFNNSRKLSKLLIDKKIKNN